MSNLRIQLLDLFQRIQIHCTSKTVVSFLNGQVREEILDLLCGTAVITALVIDLDQTVTVTLGNIGKVISPGYGI